MNTTNSQSLFYFNTNVDFTGGDVFNSTHFVLITYTGVLAMFNTSKNVIW